MLKNEFLEAVEDAVIDKAVVARIEKTYGAIESNEVRKILSLTSEPISVGDLRLLSTVEIADFEDIANVDLASKGLLPLFDAFDNDFVVYKLEEGSWSMFNIVDCIEFKEAGSLGDYLS